MYRPTYRLRQVICTQSKSSLQYSNTYTTQLFSTPVIPSPLSASSTDMNRSRKNYLAEAFALISTFRREASSLEESMEWFIEEQAFLLWYDLAPPPPTSLPISCQQVVFFTSLPVCHQSGLLGGETEWGGGGEGAKSYVGDKASWSSINHLVLSALLSDVLKGVGSTGRQPPPLSSVLYRIISKRRYILAAQLLLREKSGT